LLSKETIEISKEINKKLPQISTNGDGLGSSLPSSKGIHLKLFLLFCYMLKNGAFAWCCCCLASFTSLLAP